MEDDNTMSEPSKWALERAGRMLCEQTAWGPISLTSEPGIMPASKEALVDIARALDAARREALEEAAALCDASEARVMEKLRKLKKPNADLAGAAAVGAADNAEKLARRIRALKDREEENG